MLASVSLGAAQRDTRTQKLIDGYARREPLRSGIMGVFAMRGADTLAQYNRTVKLVPASNMKLITTGLALLELGPEMKFRTTLAHSGKISDGVLYGDLYIVGGGDPTTAAGTKCADSLSVTFGRWKSLLEASGIKEIKGRVVGDPRFFARPAAGTSWQVEDLGYNYGAGPSGLNFFENSQTFSIKPGRPGDPPFITPLYPDTPWMNYVNFAVTGEPGTGNTVYYLNTDFGPYGEFQGSYPSDRKGSRLECSNPFGAYTCAYFFHNYLMNNGISGGGGFADVSPMGLVRSDLLFSDSGEPAQRSGELTPLGSCDSPELRRIASDTNFQSDNFYAETMFNMLSVSRYGRSDRDASALAATDILARLGLRTGNAYWQIDGSGLSRKNYVSAEFFVRFLKAMYASKVSGCYLESLPSPGTESTLKHRLPGAPEELKARIRMKSGSMNGVLCYSGYILSPDGDRSKTVVFSILTNNVSGHWSVVASIIDEILLSLASEE